MIRAKVRAARAIARRVELRSEPDITPLREAIQQSDAGETLREVARSHNVSHSTISRLVPW
jgi:hypothetical protein